MSAAMALAREEQLDSCRMFDGFCDLPAATTATILTRILGPHLRVSCDAAEDEKWPGAEVEAAGMRQSIAVMLDYAINLFRADGGDHSEMT